MPPLAMVPEHDENDCPDIGPCRTQSSGDSRGSGLTEITNRIRGLHLAYGASAKHGRVHELREEDVDSWHTAKIKPPAPRPLGMHSDTGDGDVMTQFLQTPSGPRKVNEGTGEMLQRVLETIETPARNLSEMHVTLLAAGFVIGPSGHSIRAICERSGANIQSCTRSAPAAETGEDRPYRAFMIMGGKEERASAKHIIASAVELYQDLFTGKLGKSVSRHQYLCGIKFIWSPPPKSAVPDATPLQDMAPARPQGNRGRSGRARHFSPTMYSPGGTVYPAACFLRHGGAAAPEPMFVCYYPATPETLSAAGEMPGPMYLPTADSPEHAAPLMAAYWGAQGPVQGAMYGGMPGHFGIMPCGLPTGAAYGMPTMSPPHAETAESQTDHNPAQPSRTPLGAVATATTPGHTMSSLSSDYSAQMSACAKSSYRVLFDTP